jgi:hypothetical protein
VQTLAVLKAFGKPGVCTLENNSLPPGGEGKYQEMSFGRKNTPRVRDKGRKCLRKMKRGERKMKKCTG